MHMLVKKTIFHLMIFISVFFWISLVMCKTSNTNKNMSSIGEVSDNNLNCDTTILNMHDYTTNSNIIHPNKLKERILSGLEGDPDNAIAKCQ